MLNDLKQRIHIWELMSAYVITLLLGIVTSIEYRSTEITEFAIGLLGAIMGFIAIYLPFKKDTHFVIFFYFALSVIFCCGNPELCTLLAVASVTICYFPSEPKQYQVSIIVCGIIMLFFVNNFIPLLLLFELLMCLDMLLDLAEFAKTMNWQTACMIHKGRAQWTGISAIIFTICLIKYITTF